MKVLLDVGGTKYVLDPEEADKVLAIVAGAEVFEARYHSGSSSTTGNSYYTYHVYVPDGRDPKLSMDVLPEPAYQSAKMLGRP